MVVQNKYVARPQQQTVKPTMRSFESERGITKEEPRELVQNKPELKKQEVVTKTVANPPSTTGKSSGYHELSAPMTKLVDFQLMKLIRKSLKHIHHEAADDTERRFTQMLRYEVAPDIMNVIGLNVTKRLLNVHNPLSVEIQFMGKPDKLELREFLKKYNFIGFSRKAVNIFSAQLKTINDFDRLCTEVEVRCGSVRVSVSPEYQFATCPSNLKTKYKDIGLEELVADVKRYKALNKIQDKTTSETCQVTISPEKQEKSNATNTKLETVKSEKINVEKTEVQAPLQNKGGKSNAVTKAIESRTPAENIASKETIKKESPKVKTKNEIVTPSKPETKITTAPKQTTVNAKAVLEGATPIKTVTKHNPTKTVSQISPVKSDTKMNQTKDVMKAPPHKSTAKVSPTKAKNEICTKTTTPPATPKKSTDEEDDYDELDDHDILALMSEGIVLDECSGSDKE